MTNENEYSQSIQWFDWEPEWRLDKDDELQLQADIDETKEIIDYVKGVKEIGAESFPAKITQQKRNVRRGSLRKRQDPN